jgi:hypothetical protein
MALTLRDERARLKRASEKMKLEAKKATHSAIGVASAAGAAFGVSYLETRYPDGIGKGVFGIDTSLLVGVVGVALGATGMAGDEQSNHIVENVGIGSLAAYAAKMGRERGATSAAAPTA